MTTETVEETDEIEEDCYVPRFGKNTSDVYEMPVTAISELSTVVQEILPLFCTKFGYTNLAQHFIPTSGVPGKILPRRIPAHYRQDVEEQLQEMLTEGIITESSSPWMAPMVFVKKKTGGVRLCVDYRELNKQTHKDAYPLPQPDEVQDRLAGSRVFFTLDLHSGYWQLPINRNDKYKTAFSPGPGRDCSSLLDCHLACQELQVPSSGSWTRSFKAFHSLQHIWMTS